MKYPRFRWAIPVLAVCMLAACGDDDDVIQPPGGVTVADFVGSWTGTSLVFTNNADASQQVDVIALGGELRATVLTGGGTRTFFTTPDGVEDEWDAQLSVSGNSVTFTPVEATRPTRTYSFEFQGANTLILTDANASFDFTLSGGAGVPATEVVTFVRN